MKKILSLLLVGVMTVSMIPSAYATTNYTNGTQVIYNADVDNTESYTVTVPALLAPAGSGDVVAQGTWASNRKLVVTADESVTLTNNISLGDEKVLDVYFDGIALVGSNTVEVSDTQEVSVGDIEAALFGTWEGIFEYQVEMVDNVELITFTVEGISLQAEKDMTWIQFVNSQYNNVNLSINENEGVTYQLGVISNTEAIEQLQNDVIAHGEEYIVRR